MNDRKPIIVTRPDGSRHTISQYESQRVEREAAEHQKLVDSLRPGGKPLVRKPRQPLYPPVARQSSSPMVPNPPAPNTAIREVVAEDSLTLETIEQEISKAINAGTFSLEILIRSNPEQRFLLENQGFTIAGVVQRNDPNTHQSVTYLRFRTMCQRSGDGVLSVDLP